MDVDGDRSFSSGDLGKLENADDVSTNHRKDQSAESLCMLRGKGKLEALSDRHTEYEMRLQNGLVV